MAFGYSVYFADRRKKRVIRWDPDDGDVEVLAGPGRDLVEPYGLAFSGSDLLVADKFGDRIARFQGTKLEPMKLRAVDNHRARRRESPGNFDPDILSSPTSLFQEPSGAVLCTFFDDHTIYRVHSDGRLELVLGVVRNVPFLKDEPRERLSPDEAKRTPLWGPTAVVERSDGTIFFVERDAQIVREYHPDRGMKSVFALSQRARWMLEPEAPAEGSVDEYHPFSPCTLALDREGRLHVCDTVHASVLRIDTGKSRFRRVYRSPRGPEQHVDYGPLAVAFGPDGTAWLADSAAASIRAYSVGTGGEWTPSKHELRAVAGEPLHLPSGGMGLVAGR
jgi:sugar lactone lactonase YvrE